MELYTLEIITTNVSEFVETLVPKFRRDFDMCINIREILQNNTKLSYTAMLESQRDTNTVTTVKNKDKCSCDVCYLLVQKNYTHIFGQNGV